MSALDERAAHIRIFTVPVGAVGSSAVFQYAAVAADWERLRLQIDRNPPSAGESNGRAGHQLNDSTVAFHLDPRGVARIHTDDDALPADP